MQLLHIQCISVSLVKKRLALAMMQRPGPGQRYPACSFIDVSAESEKLAFTHKWRPLCRHELVTQTEIHLWDLKPLHPGLKFW